MAGKKIKSASSQTGDACGGTGSVDQGTFERLTGIRPEESRPLCPDCNPTLIRRLQAM